MSDMLKEIWQRVGDAADAGDSFDDEEVHVTRDGLTLDEQGRAEVNELLADDVRARPGHRGRERQAPEEGRAATSASRPGCRILHFRAAEPPVERDAEGQEGAKRRKKAAEAK